MLSTRQRIKVGHHFHDAPAFQKPVEGAPWVTIAVMGVTGSGKSTFIRAASGLETVEIGSSLLSCTTKMRAYSFYHRGHNITLIDSPGFNDSLRSETEILREISSFLIDSYFGRTDDDQDQSTIRRSTADAMEQKLAGIVLCQAIDQRKMTGADIRFLKIFKELCGTKSLKNVVLTPTFCHMADQDLEKHNIEELQDHPALWGTMLAYGAKVDKFECVEDAQRILRGLLPNSLVPLQIQREMIDDEKPLADTGAGKILNEELTRLQKSYREALIDAIRGHEALLKDAESTKEQQAALENLRVTWEEQLTKVQNEFNALAADERAKRRELLWMKDMMAQMHAIADSGTVHHDWSRLASQPSPEERVKQAKATAAQLASSLADMVAVIRVEETKLPSDLRDKIEKTIDEAKIELERAKTVPQEDKKRSKMKQVFKSFLKGLKSIFPRTGEDLQSSMGTVITLTNTIAGAS